MEEKNKFWKGVMTGVLVTAFVCLVTVGTSLGIYMFGRNAFDNQARIQAEQNNPAPEVSASGKEANVELDMDRVTVKLQQLEEIVNELYLFQDKTSAEDEEAGIYKGYMFGLNDPYATYYTAEELKSFMDENIGSYSGIGASVSQNRSTGLSTIVRVHKNTPAEEAGLLPGDVFYKVNGEDISGVDLTLLVNNYIKGEEGTEVEVTMYRPNTDEYKDFKITRRKLDIPTVESEMLENEIGYVMVSEFDQVTPSQFQSSIEELTKQGMKKMVVDMRNNPGGDLDAVSDMMDYILADDKTMVTVSDKYGVQDVKTSKDGHSLDIPIVILVNGSSASAAEVFTGTLKDYKLATVVGTKTFGKGIVQSLIPLSDGSGVKLTTAHYYTPSGVEIHGVGITPDVEVEMDEEAATMVTVPKDKDAQLQEAIKILKTK